MEDMYRKVEGLFPDADERGKVWAALLSKRESDRPLYLLGVDDAVRSALRSLLPSPSPAAGGSKKDRKVTALLKKLIVGQKRLEKGIYASLWLTFWGEIASTVTSETTEHFRKNLVAYYGDATDKMNVYDAEKPLRCMVTDLRLPGKWITAGHLLGRKHMAKAHVFGFNDIDDPRNGLLWNRAIEEAFSLFQIVFSWNKDEDSFFIHILDTNLVEQKISGVKLRKPFNRSLDHFIDGHTKQEFENMTFADLEGKLMVFNNLNRPLKRVLCVHARLGIDKARLEGKLPPGLDLGKYNFDYWTESADSKVLQTFLKDSQAWINERESNDDVEALLEDLSITAEGSSSQSEHSSA